MLKKNLIRSRDSVPLLLRAVCRGDEGMTSQEKRVDHNSQACGMIRFESNKYLNTSALIANTITEQNDNYM